MSAFEPLVTENTTAVHRLARAYAGDGGARWTKVASPCDLQSTGTGGIAFDATGHLVVDCEGVGAGGGARKLLRRAVDSPPTAWTTLPPLPEQGTGMRLELAPEAWGARSPLLSTVDGGTSWTEHRDVADGDVRAVEDACAFAGGGGAALVWDPDRQAILLLLSADGATWREAAAYPG